MRVGMVVIGVIFLLVGIVLESLYLAKSASSAYGVTISQNTFLATGIVFLLAGLLLLWIGGRIPKVQPVQA